MAKSRKHQPQTPDPLVLGKKTASPKESASAAYEVILTKAAEAAYERFYQRAAEARDRRELTSFHYTTLNMIDEVIEQIIPRDPFNKRYALQGTLSGLFRMQKGRLRIVWIGNSERRQVAVIFISETLRKEGDKNDPYRVLTGMLLSGEYDQVFQDLGLPKPSRIPRASTRQIFQ